MTSVVTTVIKRPVSLQVHGFGGVEGDAAYGRTVLCG